MREALSLRGFAILFSIAQIVFLNRKKGIVVVRGYCNSNTIQ